MKVYLLTLLGCTIYFFLVHELLTKIFLYSKLKGYMAKENETQRVWYVMNWVTIVHHVMILPMIFYVLRNSCSNEKGWPWPTKAGGSYSKLGGDKKWGFFKDQECFIEVNKGYILLQLFSISYMVHEYIRIQLYLEAWNRYIWETIFHHVVITFAFLCSMIAGYALPGICCLFLIAEVSSIFLNYVDMFDEKTTNSALALANKIAFFISYTVTRVISWPYLQYLLFKNLIF